MTFKQIFVEGKFMYGLSEEGTLYVCQINEWGQQWTPWKQFGNKTE